MKIFSTRKYPTTMFKLGLFRTDKLKLVLNFEFMLKDRGIVHANTEREQLEAELYLCYVLQETVLDKVGIITLPIYIL